MNIFWTPMSATENRSIYRSPPNRDGELYLYVNDMVLPVYMDYFYRSNRGTATVTVVQKDKSGP